MKTRRRGRRGMRGTEEADGANRLVSKKDDGEVFDASERACSASGY